MYNHPLYTDYLNNNNAAEYSADSDIFYTQWGIYSSSLQYYLHVL